MKKNIPWDYHGMSNIPGGWGGIRTPGGVAPTTVFKTVAIDRSATHPKLHHTAGLSNLRFCSLAAPGGAAHHSFALDCADACLADSYARPSQSTALPPILNFIIPPVFQTCGFVRWPHLAVLLTTRSHSTALTLVSLTRMQDRRNRPRLPPILNFIIPPVFQTCGVG